MSERITLVGAGAVGTALLVRFCERGYRPECVVSRTRRSAHEVARLVGAPRWSMSMADIPEETTFLLVAVPDDALPSVVRRLAGEWAMREGTTLVHTSGVLSASVFDPLRSRRPVCLSIHPLCSFLGRDGRATDFSEVYFGVEGDDLAFADTIVKGLGGKPIRIPAGQKQLYHAGCTFASNYLVALLDMAEQLLCKAGLPEKEVPRVLAPLVDATLVNVGLRRPAAALTGPVARGDVKTVSAHLDALELDAPELTECYKALGEQTRKLAMRSGRLSYEVSGRLAELFGGERAFE